MNISTFRCFSCYMVCTGQRPLLEDHCKKDCWGSTGVKSPSLKDFFFFSFKDVCLSECL